MKFKTIITIKFKCLITISSFPQSKKRFNDVLSQNAKLRDEIESHRNEHRRFDTLMKKLEKELKNLRREMGEIIEASTAAYDARYDN